MRLKSLLRIPDNKYSAKTILQWLWLAWNGNRLQAMINASIGVLQVIVSLAQVWAVKRAIDVASGQLHLLGRGRDGTIYPGRFFTLDSQHLGKKPLGNKGPEPHATAYARPTS